MQELAEEYEDEVAFLFVGIASPGHPSDKTIALIGQCYFDRDEIDAEPVRLTRKGLEAYRIAFPGMHDVTGQVQNAYGAYPKRLLIISTDGRIVFDGSRGKDLSYRPTFWDLDEVEEHLLLALREVVPEK